MIVDDINERILETGLSVAPQKDSEESNGGVDDQKTIENGLSLDKKTGSISVVLEEQKQERHQALSRHESIMIKDQSSGDLKLGSMSQIRLGNTVYESKLTKSVIGTKLYQSTSIISPLKKQLERLTQQRHDLVDEETQRDFDKIKMNLNQTYRDTNNVYDEFDVSKMILKNRHSYPFSNDNKQNFNIKS